LKDSDRTLLTPRCNPPTLSENLLFGPILTYNTIFVSKYSPNIFTSNRAMWVPKIAEFYAYSKSEDKIEKK